MRVTITGASGLIGTKLDDRARSSAATRSSRSRCATDRRPGRARRPRRRRPPGGRERRPALDATTRASASSESREQGTRRLVEAINAGRAAAARADQLERRRLLRPARRRARSTRTRPPGDDFLAQVCVAWEREADAGREHASCVQVRTGVVLDPDGGALSKMLLPFKLGVGGPVAGGKQYMPWIHVDDVVGIYLARARRPRLVRRRSTPPRPSPSPTRSSARRSGKALHRPAVAPIPGVRDPAALRRHGGDRHRGPARRSRAHARRSATRSSTPIWTRRSRRDALERTLAARAAAPRGRATASGRRCPARVPNGADRLPLGLRLGRHEQPDDRRRSPSGTGPVARPALSP